MDRILLNVSMGPHIHDGSRHSSIMTGYLAALIPAAIWGIYLYGIIGFRTLAFSVASAIIWEYLARLLMHREVSLSDWSAVVEGLIMGMLLPANTPWWIVLVATFLMIVIAKQLFGGNGYYPFNPVLIGFAITALSWPKYVLSHYTLAELPLKMQHLEPLWALRSYGPFAANNFDLRDLFLGYQVGGVGTAPGLLICLGGIYLILRGFISARISLSFIMGIVVIQGIFYVINPQQYANPFFHLFSGRTLFVAFFLASNYTTSPVNKLARIIYGFGAAFMTIMMRNFGAFPDGTIGALLIMNMFHPIIDRIRKPVIGLDIATLKFDEQ